VIAEPLADTRNTLLVTHTYADMVAANTMAIACGYEDADDLDALRHDPALKIACDRAPESDGGLPSQPTISRLENLADLRALWRIGIGLIDLFLSDRQHVCAAPLNHPYSRKNIFQTSVSPARFQSQNGTIMFPERSLSVLALDGCKVIKLNNTIILNCRTFILNFLY